MTLGTIDHIEINNNGTVSIDGIVYDSPESVIVDYPSLINGTLLDFIFDCEINCGGLYD